MAVNALKLDEDLIEAGVPREAFGGVTSNADGSPRIDWTPAATAGHRALAAPIVAAHDPSPRPRPTPEEALVLEGDASLTGPQAAAVVAALAKARAAARARLGW